MQRTNHVQTSIFEMFKLIVLSLAVVSAVLADTTFELLPKNSRVFIEPKAGEEISHAEGFVSGASVFAVPSDNGGNFGDNIWRNRVAGDVLLSREIQINGKSGLDQTFNWNANFPGKSLTHIRFLNIGRERAYVQSVSSAGGSSASAVLQIAANRQFRLLIEVYGR